MLLDVMLGLLTPPAVGYAWLRAVKGSNFYLTWATSAAGGMIGTALPPPSLTLIVSNAASGAVALLLWWLSRRKRKRAPRAYGAKSRALLAAVVRRAREAAKPRPVLRPQPGGVS